MDEFQKSTDHKIGQLTLKSEFIEISADLTNRVISMEKSTGGFTGNLEKVDRELQ